MSSALENRLEKVEAASDNSRKKVAVIDMGDAATEEEACERHYREHPEDRGAKLTVIIVDPTRMD